jgi:LysR family transcriptional regulator, low CO2-responsive transcriptional regulator
VDSRISLHRLEVFCLVVDAGGVTRAAEQLFVAQPAVSAQIRALESAAGAQLFSRQGSTLKLTEAGTRVYDWARQVLAGATAVSRDLAEITAGTAGSVRIAASMAIGSYLVPPIVARMRAQRPHADITVQIGEPTAMLHTVAIGSADFAIATWTPITHDELSAELLWQEPLVLCASPAGPPDADSIALSEISRLPYVGVPQKNAFHAMLDGQLRAHGIDSWPHVLRLGHAEPIKRAVAEYGWVTLAPRYAVADELADGRLRAVEIRDARLKEGVGLYFRAGEYLSPLKQAAIAALRAAAPGSVITAPVDAQRSVDS